MLNYLIKWLRIEKPTGAAISPSRKFEVHAPIERVFDASVEGIERVLGGAVRESDPQIGVIEATFGLAFSERLTCSFERVEPARTGVRIQSRRLAQAEVRTKSDYVDRLASFLQERFKK